MHIVGFVLDSLPTACSTALAEHLRPALFKALCDPRRLALLARFAVTAEPLTVSQAADGCDVHLSGVSRHLSVLRDAGILLASKRGREVTYRLDCGALVSTLRGLADAVEACQAACCPPNHQENPDERD